ILFEIPAAPRGMPIACNGHFYARAGESLTNLSLDKIDEIRAQTAMTDWSAQIVPDATLDDLDPVAVQKARDAFARKHSGRLSPDEIEGWTTAAFLDRAKITQNGKITRAA